MNGVKFSLQDGVNVEILKTNLQNPVIEIKSLYQITLIDKNPLQSVTS